MSVGVSLVRCRRCQRGTTGLVGSAQNTVQRNNTNTTQAGTPTGQSSVFFVRSWRKSPKEVWRTIREDCRSPSVWPRSRSRTAERLQHAGGHDRVRAPSPYDARPLEKKFSNACCVPCVQIAGRCARWPPRQQLWLGPWWLAHFAVQDFHAESRGLDASCGGGRDDGRGAQGGGHQPA